jgi:hypothetical protein
MQNKDSLIIKVDDEFIYLNTYNLIYKLNLENGTLSKSIALRGMRPYFIANEKHLYGIVNNEKRINVYNLDLELIDKIEYNDNYDKVFFNTNGSLIILKHGRFPNVLVV